MICHQRDTMEKDTTSLLGIPATNAQPKRSHLTQHTNPY